MSAFYGAPASDEERFKLLDRVIELGSTYIDSADIYGDNEELLGKYFKKNPGQRKKVSEKNGDDRKHFLFSQVFLATKFANVMLPNTMPTVRGDAQYVREAFAKSLQRLGLDSVDLYYVHRIDKKVPIEETIGVLKEFVQAGKIKYIGLSECSSETIRRAHAVHPISAVQIEYSPFSLDIESEEIGVLKTCRELGIAIVCYSPLGRGLLTGQIRSPDDFEANDFRRMAPRFSKENFPKNLELVNTLAAIGKRKNCTSGQLTLAWILAQGDDFFVIPGTSKVKNLEENVGAAKVKLSKDEVQEIRSACEKTVVAGGRYPEAFSSALYGDSAPKKT